MNTKVRVRGHDGVITKYNRKNIIIRVADGVELIDMRDWRKEKWAILYNGEFKRVADIGKGEES